LRKSSSPKRTRTKRSSTAHKKKKEKPRESRVNDVFLAVTAAVGTPLEYTLTRLEEEFGKQQYQWKAFHLSELSKLIKLSVGFPKSGSPEFKRIKNLMDRGNELRKITGQHAILAMLGIRQAVVSREAWSADDKSIAALFRQLKHPDEVHKLRDVYDEGFQLIGVHSPKTQRQHYLIQKGLSPEEADELIATDEYEGPLYGQRVRDTFHLSDVFVRAVGDQSDEIELRGQLTRFVGLLFGQGFYTPTFDEYGMFLAWSSGLRSAQLSRQVGAAILSPQGELLGLGANEVPRAHGGQYWEGQEGGDGRDHMDERGDSSSYMKYDMLAEIMAEIDPNWENLTPKTTQKRLISLQDKLKNTRSMNLTEFTRAVHAEMEALLSAAKIGVSVRGATLYTTTFPCHNCTKHIVGAGIERVVYIEPYPKSLAYDLHKDAIIVDEPFRKNDTATPIDNRIAFDAFVGIAPRRYADLFSMTSKSGRIIRRKDELGKPDPNIGLRLHPQIGSYQDREDLVAKDVAKLK
jgi:deoxycytidylate deaminase